MRIPLLLFSISSFGLHAQFQLEHSYPNAGSVTSGNQLYLVNLEDLGDHYFFHDKAARSVTLFDLDHTQVQTIDLSGVPDPAGNAAYSQILYVSQYLFDLDPGIEFMYLIGGTNPTNPVTHIIDESGAVIQSFPNEAGYVQVNAPQVHVPIYNTVTGTKLILSNQITHEAKVYSLPGSLSTNMVLVNGTADLNNSKIYPNPTDGSISIELSRPLQGTGLIRIYSMNGAAVMEKKIDSIYTTLSISHMEAAAYRYVIYESGMPKAEGTIVLQ
jgi:hypothetical protein